MRLHSLGITAFGPFAQTVEVDFDELSGAGLFLLSGATGAGKTSVLDAVCFALYGEVPGDRNSAKRLRADQAAQGVRPSVVLETTIDGRRLRVTRSPAWQRPKKRSAGMTTEQASVVVQELVGDSWVTRTTRVDEAGHFISSLLRMTLSQFCQVALLPQGRFQSFLRARSEDRHQLLQQLFRTQRFADIEAWLGDHRRQLRRDSADAQEVVVGVLNRVCEAANLAAPPPIQPDIETLVELDGWVSGLVEQAQFLLNEAQLRSSQTTDEAEAATQALETAVECARLRAEYIAASQEADALTTEQPDHQRRVRQVELAARAASLSPLITLAETSEQDLVTLRACLDAQAGVTQLTEELAETGDPLSLVQANVRTTADELARVQALQPAGAELDRLSEASSQAKDDSDRLRLAQVTAELALADNTRTLSQLQDEHGRCREAHHRLTELSDQQVEVAELLAAHDAHSAVSERLAEAAAELNEVKARTLMLKERWLEVRESRLNGMAAEIASTLVVGGSCPVCGSAEHPHLALASPHAPDAKAERQARSSLDDSEAELLAFQDRHRDLVIQLALLSTQVGDSERETLRAAHDQLKREVGAARQAAAGLADLEANVLLATGRQVELTHELQQTQLRLSQADAVLAQLAPLIQQRQAELVAALGGLPNTTIEAATLLLQSRLTHLRAFLSIVQDWHAAAEVNRQHQEALSDSASSLGFTDVKAAKSAILLPTDRAALQEQIADYAARLATTEGVLRSEPHRLAIAAAEPPVLALQDRRTVAEAESMAADQALTTLRTRASRLVDLQRQLRQTLEGWRPIIEGLQLAVRVAALTDGSSSDNTLQMRLSGYVLSYRLQQVVAAANERLVAMSDQRYSLEHSARRGAGERRGGLSLLVRDDWSGESRDPATLSGGETFVVSLSLALGLADVITHEVGGADLDTLFVDEGFGALDSETLDDVMDTLDSLRAGGRVVGVVSHVAEMRHRIPTRLHVTKRRQGSTLSLIHGD
jgi:DNA repair protein SbcC/Rad50